MKIFISQPMGNKSYEQIKFERQNLVRQFEQKGDEVLETVFDDYDELKTPIYYLAKSIEILDKADRVVFMKGWEKARGCKIEYEIARNYGKEILLLEEELY